MRFTDKFVLELALCAETSHAWLLHTGKRAEARERDLTSDAA